MGCVGYGTGYGLLVEFHKEQNRNAMSQLQSNNGGACQKGVAGALHSEVSAEAAVDTAAVNTTTATVVASLLNQLSTDA